MEEDALSHEGTKYGSVQGQSPAASNNMNIPPSKRRRTGISTSLDCQTPLSSSVHDDVVAPPSPSSSISSDTSGEVPNSPGTLALLGANQDDDYSGQGTDQVTVCRWEGCDAGDLGNMDALVQHIRDEHIGGRQKKYLCEWADCSRKGQTHASGYALRAHMRSHTREKPFYCTLPGKFISFLLFLYREDERTGPTNCAECDRSFTRSDALTKHMRTVHETEALRPPDAAPLGVSVAGTNKPQRIKLKLPVPPKDPSDAEQQQQQQGDGGGGRDSGGGAVSSSEFAGMDQADLSEFETEIGLDEHELSLPPRELWRLLRRQVHWAEQEGARLRDEWDRMGPKRKQAWQEKETIFNNMMEAESRYVDAAARAAGSLENGNNDEVDKANNTGPVNGVKENEMYKDTKPAIGAEA